MEINPIANKVSHNCEKCATNYYRLFNGTNNINC